MGATCLIEFEKDNYWAGQTLNGKVTLTADNIEQVQAVVLKIKGCAHTSWSEKDLGDDDSSTTYSAHVDYIKSKSYLFDYASDSKSNNEQLVIIQPGVHCFSFTCHIPYESPSSVEGIHGYIRYWVQVTFKRSWKFDKTYKKCFTLSNIKDLNHDGYLRLPVNADISRPFCCGLLESDSLKIHVQLPQAGYVPGQLLPVNILITNETLAHINEIRLRLMMLITYFSKTPKGTNREMKTISKLKGDAVPRRCKKSFNYLLPIPATPPTCTTPSSIIHITYRVEVEAKVQSILYANQFIQIPVTIGNVPLQMDGMTVQQQPMPTQFNIENGMENSMGGSRTNLKLQINSSHSTNKENLEPWSALKDITPPVYMVATHMPEGKLSENTEHEYGEKCFAPKYPVFDIPSPTRLQQSNGDQTDGHGAISMAMDPDKTTWL